jgi:RHS repeat-associated protein
VVNWSFDAAGNRTQDGARIYTWDAENRLTGIQRLSDGHLSSFAYDGLGRRVVNTEQAAGGLATTTRYAWCPDDTIPCASSINAAGEILYETQGEYGGSPSALYYARDHLGSVMQTVDASGNTLGSRTYRAFGQPYNATGTNPSKGFAGMLVHPASGLQLTPARVFNGTSGRWLSRDPLGEAAGVNLYAYVKNNPVMAIDPVGLASTLITTFDTFFGLEYGSHSALYIKSPGTEAFLYDPAGSYNPGNTRGEDGTFYGASANLANYINYQTSTGSVVQTITLGTTMQEEEAIEARASTIEDPRGFSCAASVSAAIDGVCGISQTRLPGNLYYSAKKSSCNKR